MVKNKLRLFWVDDERFFQLDHLEELRGEFDVIFHNTAEEAINRICNDRSLDGVILDVMMDAPVGSRPSEAGQGSFSTGIWIYKEVAKEARERCLPICILTKREVKGVREELGEMEFSGGVLRLISKDISPRELRTVLREMLQESKHPSNCPPGPPRPVSRPRGPRGSKPMGR